MCCNNSKLSAMARFLLSMACLLFSHLAHSGLILSFSDSSPHPITIEKDIEFFEDADSKLSLQDISSSRFKDKFQRSENLNFGYTNSSYWMRFTLSNPYTEPFHGYLGQRFSNIYYLDLFEPIENTKTYRTRRAGNLRTSEVRDVVDARPMFRINIGPGEVKTYYLHAKSGGSLHLALQLMDSSYYIQNEKRWYLLYGVYYGILVVMLFYNFIIYFFLRDPAYKWLTLFVSTILWGSLFYHGFMQLVLPKEIISLSAYSISFIVPFICVSLLQFTNTFLVFPNSSSLINRVNTVLIWLSLSSLIVVPLGNVNSMYVMGPIFNAIIIFCFYRLFHAVKHQASSARLFAVSWLFMLISTALVSLSNYNLVPANTLTMNSYLFGIIWMVLFMSIALADRVNKLKLSAEQSKQALNKSESERLIVLEASKLGLWAWDIKDNKLTWARETEEIYGLDEGSFSSTVEHAMSLTHPDDIEYLKNNIDLTVRKHTPFYVEFRIIRPNGQQRWLSSYAKLEFDDKKEPIRLLGTVQDITEYKQTKEELRDSEQIYHHLFQSAAEGFVIATQEGEIVDANPAAFEIFDCDKDAFLQLSLEKLVDSDDRQKISRLIQELKNGASFYSDEATGSKLDKSTFDLHIQANTINYQSKPHIFAILHDFSKLRKTHNAIKLVASGVADYTGLLFFQHLVLQLAKVCQTKHALVTIIKGGSTAHENTMTSLAYCRFGKIVENIDLDLEGSLCDPKYSPIIQSLAKDVLELYPDDKFLHEIAAESLICAQIQNSDGTPLGYLLVIDDRTRLDLEHFSEILQIFAARAAAEIERMQAEEFLRKGHEKLEALVATRTLELSAVNQELESFSYSVSHDLRAPLRAIEGYSTLLHEELDEFKNDNIAEFIKSIRRNAIQMSQLIDDLLALSRVTRKELTTKDINLSKIVAESVTACREREPRSNITVTIEPDVWINGDPGLMSIAINNLVSNAWKYTRKKQHAILEFGTKKKGGKLCYYIKDNGTGFDMKFADKLFSAFHRLHASNEYEGTGIGLATVYRIIKRHGGSVWSTSSKGNGATFYFNLQTNKIDQSKIVTNSEIQ